MPSACGAGSFSGLDSWSSFSLSPSCLKTKHYYQPGNQTEQFSLFVEVSPSYWLKKLAPLCHPIRSKTKTNCESLAHGFPRFASRVHWVACVLCDWSAKVITFGLRHSHENLSTQSRTEPARAEGMQSTLVVRAKKVLDGKSAPT